MNPFPSLSRRDFLLTSASVAAGCGRKHGTGFGGYAFVAIEGSRSVAAIDLTSFSVARQIALEAPPAQAIAHPGRPAIYVLLPQAGTVVEIDARSLAIKRRVRDGGPALSMGMAADNRALWMLEPRALVEIRLDSFQPSSRIPLPSQALELDLNDNQGRRAAVSFVSGPPALIDLASGKLHRFEEPDDAGLIRFQSDGRQVLAASRGARRISILDAASRRLVVHLPLPVQPEHFCFNSDTGQMFVTGQGMDAVTIVYPYSTEVDQTVLAGRTPGAMAVATSPDGAEYLFVSNRQSGDVTVMTVGNRKITAAIPVGKDPGEIAITPDQQYALVLNRESGDVAVIRIAALIQSNHKKFPAPLFTMIAVGARPVSAAVVPV